jgi:hypothetical protein
LAGPTQRFGYRQRPRPINQICHHRPLTPQEDRHPDADQFDVRTPTTSGAFTFHTASIQATLGRLGINPKVLAAEFIHNIEPRHQPDPHATVGCPAMKEPP